MTVCLIPVRMVEIAQMELMNTIVPVFLDTLEQTVKQVNCCCKLYCNMQVFFCVYDHRFQNLNTENHSNVSECNSLYSEILTRSLCVIFVLDVNDCMPNPCENGGNCTDGVNEYLCTCITGYTGTDCETGKYRNSLHVSECNCLLL